MYMYKYNTHTKLGFVSTPTAAGMETGLRLLSPVLRKSMYLLDQRRHHSFNGYIQQTLQMLHSLLVGEAQLQVLLNLLDGLVRFQCNIRHRCIHHQREQIEHNVRMASQMQIRCIALLAELMIIFRTIAAHRLDHLLAQLHGWWHGLGIAAEYEAEINVKQFAIGGQKQIVEMTISHACSRLQLSISYVHLLRTALAHTQQIGDDTVAGATLDISVHYFGRNAVQGALAWMVSPEEVQYVALAGEHLGHRARIDILQKAVLGAGRQHLVWR